MILNAPANDWSSFLSQWKPTPIVTPQSLKVGSANIVESVRGGSGCGVEDEPVRNVEVDCLGRGLAQVAACPGCGKDECVGSGCGEGTGDGRSVLPGLACGPVEVIALECCTCSRDGGAIEVHVGRVGEEISRPHVDVEILVVGGVRFAGEHDGERTDHQH